jgi:hypothetical protein
MAVADGSPRTLPDHASETHIPRNPKAYSATARLET